MFGLLGPNGAMHRIKSGAQRIVIDVRGRPTAAGIDSRHLMIDTDPSNNTLPIGKPR
jgi:hypothetical protein